MTPYRWYFVINCYYRKYPRSKVVPLLLKVFENIIKTQEEINTITHKLSEATEDESARKELETELENTKIRLSKFTSLNDYKFQMKFHKLQLPKAYHKAVGALKAGGFEFTPDTSHLVLNPDNFGLMMQVRELIEERWNEEQKGYQKQAEKVIAKSHAKQAQAKKKHDEERAKVVEKIGLDHKDMAQEFKPHMDSKAKDLKFGKTDVKLEFKKGGG